MPNQNPDQTKDYAEAKLKWVQHTGQPLPFLYEATGVITRFTDQRDPKPRSREVFSFHRPETLRELLSQEKSLRARLLELPALIPIDLRDCQVTAVTELDGSVKKAKPRSLVQMATGSGKTFTSITFIYRLLKHPRIRRVLFLVDTRNLGEQAEQEFLAYTPSDDNRKFSELYTVQRLNSSHVPKDAEETEVTQNGGTVLKGLVEKREKLTRAKRWEQQDEDEAYSNKALDRDIVNKSQVRPSAVP